MLTRRMAGLATAALLISIGGCSKPEPPTLVPKEAQVTAVGPTGVSLLVRLEATNPNRFALSAQSVTGKAKLDGKWELGTVTITKPIVLPPHTPTMVDVPMTLPWNDLKTLTALASSTGPVPYVVEGTVAIGGERINVNLPFALSGQITREQIVGAALKSFILPPGFKTP